MGNGKEFTKVSSSVSTTEYTAFDILGRVTAAKQTTEGGDAAGYSTGYTYNLSGALVEETYPSGRKVKNVLDNDGELSLVQSARCGVVNGVTATCSDPQGYFSYAKSFTYNASGAVTSMQLGNGRWESTTFNSRLQPTQIALGTVQNATDKLKLDYTYGTTANNGNVLSQKITVARSGQTDMVFDQTYTYDSLNRLKMAEEKTGTTTNWKQTFVFDRYGNRNFDRANTTQPASFANPNVTDPSVDAANNRFTSGQGYTYDAAGNVITDAEGRTFTYDGENKQIEVRNSGSSTIGQYYFDGDGKRVKKYVPSTGETTVFVYDASGKLVAEYSTNISATPRVQYQTLDNLGTPRINTDQLGAVVSRTDYMPYGEEIIGLGGRTAADHYTADDVRQGFTGYINDEETDLDFAQARMYSNRHGRFTAVDPLYIEFRRMPFPQAWNLYAYTRNNPLLFTDPAGLDVEVTGNWQEDYLSRLQENVSFRVQLDKKTNKVVIVDENGNALDGKALKALGKSLKKKKAEKQLFNAITDQKSHVKIETVKDDPNVDFGKFLGKGSQIIDVGDLDVLDQSTDNGGFTSAHDVGHETLEAYYAAEYGLKRIDEAHEYANQYFAGLGEGNPKTSRLDFDKNGFIIRSSILQPVQDSRNIILRIDREYVTPINPKAIPKNANPANITKVEKVP